MENTSLDGAKNASCGAFWIANRFFYYFWNLYS